MFKLKLKGGALYIALIISIIIGITLSFFILIAYYNQKQVLDDISVTQLQWNIESAMSIAQSPGFTESENNVWRKNDFNTDSVRIKKMQWGAYLFVGAQSKNKHHFIKQEGLFGMTAFRDTALIIADGGRPVNLAGKIKFTGGCYFPKPGYKTTYIEGSSFIAEGNFAAYIRQAPAHIPVAEDQYLKNIETAISGLNPKTDSLIANINEVKNPFSNKTAVFQAGQMYLQTNVLKGNVKLVANEKVVIDKNAKLEDILIVAKKIIVKKEFTGSLHLIATDSIILEENCTLKYPSSLVVLRTAGEKSENVFGVFIGKDCRVEGAVLALKKEESEQKVMVALNAGCEIYGMVYSSGFAGIQGKIFGSAFCERLILKTPSAIYENHLLNCELDPKKYGNSMAIPVVFEKSKMNKCVKWL